MMPRWRRAALVLFAVALLAAVPVAGADADLAGVEPPDNGSVADVASVDRAAAQSNQIVRRTTLSLTPERRGSFDATVSYEVPDSVEELMVRPITDATVVETPGFEVDPEGYVWDGETASPSLVLRVPANHTSTRTYEYVESGYTFVDAGPWALVRVPTVATRWSTTDERTELTTEVRAERGVAGDAIAFLGDATVRERTAHGQTFRLVVPEVAGVGPGAGAVLDSLSAASRDLRVGDRDRMVPVFVAPTTVSWGVTGVQLGDTDVWVKADEPLAAPDNTWLHEYVHTRQNFSTDPSGRWLAEATAEYYAARLSHEQGLISFDTLRDLLARGTTFPYRDDVLASPATWTPLTPYAKGALVVGGVDRQIRLATGSSLTFDSVFDRLNDAPAPVDNERFLRTVGDADGMASLEFARRYATTRAAPATWDEAAHREAFGTEPPLMDYVFLPETDPALRVSGPWRNTTTTAPPTLAVGERFAVDVAVRNTGDVAGPYEAALRAGDRTTDAATGRLGAGDQETVELAAAFDQPGEYDVSVGFETIQVTVVEPAEAQVSRLRVNRSTVAPGDPVEVTARTDSPDDRPARGTVEFAAAGDIVASETVYLNAGEERDVSTVVSFDDTGERVVEAGSARTTVTVERRAVPQPGVGIAGALLALVVAALARRHR
jgi:hypothetical protein